MRQNDKNLLIKDISSRLPYGVIVHLKYDENTSVTREMGLGSLHDIMFDSAEGKPYLRSMSSMTEEEWNDYKSTWKLIEHDLEDTYEPCIESFDWLNTHHFDYRGLIEKGLAIEAPEGMYN